MFATKKEPYYYYVSLKFNLSCAETYNTYLDSELLSDYENKLDRTKHYIEKIKTLRKIRELREEIKEYEKD